MIVNRHDHGEVVILRSEHRCTGCGHRLPVNGVNPRESRARPPWTWPFEMIDRYRATRLR